MNKRKSEEEWMQLVKKFNSSGLNVTAWCRENGISKGSFYPYLNKFKALANEPSEQKWGAIAIPKNIETSSISLTVANITLNIKSGFDKETLKDILSIVTNLC